MDYKAIAEWAVTGRTGLSSRCMAAHMMGLKTTGDWPRDGGDFGRCEELLEAVPELRCRIMEMAEVNRYWAAIVPHWDAIKASPDKYATIDGLVRDARGQEHLREDLRVTLGRHF